ncbi:hypothetical protein [Dyella lutea]|uniref:Uncharacterized protein n=1 Tax=Dyella lutea TaxID=2950441 RepID=A0ABT1FF48_9GAMM|nr:hypothetical protein [Dyella lutea]MCP1376009.1 hypothetical protein [Dyella lutea]
MNGTLIDFRHLDAPKPKPKCDPEFLPPDPEDVEKARKFKERLWVERESAKYKKTEGTR